MGPSIVVFEVMIYLNACYVFIPNLVFPRHLMETLVPDRNHWMYYLFYDYNPLFSFLMAVSCFLFFVLHLKKGAYRYQIRIFIFSLLGAIFGFAGSLVACKNAYKGLIWVLLPHSAMIVNDCSAYLVGLTTLGRTRLIKVSAHRTLEGFIVGLLSSSIWCYFAFFWFTQSPQLICP